MKKLTKRFISFILSGILIASGVGSLSVALKKFGAKELEHIFIRTINLCESGLFAKCLQFRLKNCLDSIHRRKIRSSVNRTDENIPSVSAPDDPFRGPART